LETVQEEINSPSSKHQELPVPSNEHKSTKGISKIAEQSWVL
jgi:hypothetical protein